MTQQELLPIPQPPEKPFLGNLLEFDRVSPVQGLVKLANRYGPIFQLNVRGRRLIVVSGFSLVDELCDQSRFDKTVDGALQKVRAFTGNGLFTANTADPDWSKGAQYFATKFQPSRDGVLSRNDAGCRESASGEMGSAQQRRRN